MQIECIRHKALRRLAETGSTQGLPSGLVDRLRKMLAYIDSIKTADELRVSGNRKGEWSLAVTRNWRMTFRVNDAGAIEDMDLEDYH